jgi:hypothetical protein
MWNRAPDSLGSLIQSSESIKAAEHFGVDTEVNRFLGRLVPQVALQPDLKPAIFSLPEKGLVRSERARPRLIPGVFS